MVAIFTGAGAGFQRGSANILGAAGQIGSSLLGRASASVSVNAANGNLLISQQDEFLVGLGPDVGISRSYNSLQDAADGDNGDHWQQSTTRRVFGLTGTLNSAGSTISRLSGDGSVIVYGWDAARSAYAYDKRGLLTSETLPVQSYNSNGNAVGTITNAYTYDERGNLISRVEAEGLAEERTTEFEYDLFDRLVLTRHEAVSGATIDAASKALCIVSGNPIEKIEYDPNGNVISTTDASGAKTLFIYDELNRKTGEIDALGALTTYSYDAAGNVTRVTTYDIQGSPSGSPRVTSSYDALGRLNGHLEYDASGNLAYERFDIVYNSRNQVLSEKGKVKQGSDWIYNHTINYYNDTGYTVSSTPPSQITSVNSVGSSTGNVLQYSRTKYGTLTGSGGSLTYGSSADNAITDTSDAYWYKYHEDRGFLQARIASTNQWGTGVTVNSYDGQGNIVDADRYRGAYGWQEDVYFATDSYGEIVDRMEYQDEDPWIDQALPRTHTYRFGGREIGILSTDGTDNVDYSTLIDHRDDTGSGKFRYGSTTGTPYADFDANHVTMASGAQEDSASSYMVRGGETLQSIALAVWGDANLWYKLAEANGVSGGSLQAGQRLIIPNGVVGIHNNADTIRPYDPNGALGDISPPHAVPPKPTDSHGGCGFFGQLLVAAVAIAVTVIAPFGPGQVVANAVAGNLAGQAVGVTTGVQDGFNFQSLAASALTAGIGPGGTGNPLADGLASAVTNAAIQAIGVATGLQKKFNWAGVAAAGVGGAIGSALGGDLKPLSEAGGRSFGNIVGHIGLGIVRSLASAATKSAIEGSNFGDNILAGLPDVIGGVLGQAVAGEIRGKGLPKPGTGKIAAADGPSDIMSDIGTPGERAAANAIRELREGGVDSPDEPPLQVTVTDDSPWDRADLLTYEYNPEDSSHGLGWKIADLLGFHEGGRLYSIFHGQSNRQYSITSFLQTVGEAEMVHAQQYDIRPALTAYSVFAAQPLTPPVGRNAISEQYGSPFALEAAYTSHLLLGKMGSPNPAKWNYSAPVTNGEAIEILSSAGGIFAETIAVERASIYSLGIGNSAKSGDALLVGRGVTDAGLRKSILDTGFNPAILNEASPTTLARFDKLFQGSLDAGKSFRGRLGNLSTRARTIETAVDIDRAGLTPGFEAIVRLGGGNARFVDVVGMNGDKTVQFFQLYRDAPSGGIPLREIDAASDIFTKTGIRPIMIRTGP